VPIVRDLHWTLVRGPWSASVAALLDRLRPQAIICHPVLLLHEPIFIVDDDDDDGDAAAEQSCIIFLDSLGMHNSEKVASNLRVYLELERKKRGRVSAALADAPVLLEHLPLVTPKAPVQENGCDCGLYLLRYFEELLPLLLSSDADVAPDVRVTRAAIKTKFAAHKFADWFKPRAIAKMRAELAVCIRRIEEGITGKSSLVTPPAPGGAAADDAASHNMSLHDASPPVPVPAAADDAASPNALVPVASGPGASLPDVSPSDAPKSDVLCNSHASTPNSTDSDSNEDSSSESDAS
jgi:hypothetical protein